MAYRFFLHARPICTACGFFVLFCALLAGCGDNVIRESQHAQDRSGIPLTKVMDPGENELFQPPDKVLQKIDQKAPHEPANAYGDSKAKKPKDYVSLNGSIFVDWKKPKAAILLSGLLDGYVEPCGCAGARKSEGWTESTHGSCGAIKRKRVAPCSH